MRQFLRIAIFISLLNLCMQKNVAVGGEILNVNKTNLRNETPEEGVPSEGEFPTSSQEEKGEDSIEEVIKQTSEETTEFTEEGKEVKNKAAHELLKRTNQHNLGLVGISSQDGDNVNDKNEEVKEEAVEYGGEEEVVKHGGEEEVQTLEVEDDVDEEEEDEEDDDDGEEDEEDDDDGDGDDGEGDDGEGDDGEGDHDDNDEDDNDENDRDD
uniref:Merozoite surface protein 3 n=1 Tax=Plasmodium cynomolgi TaxID=5827 RepID=X2CML0_9APIC|nr:merozoite surface protein 3 [Plasmodium cynomolgi]